MPDHSFFEELRKRKIPQAAAIYVAVAWGITEVVVTIAQHLFLPRWISTLAVIGFVVGFPIAMSLAWTFDFTAEGIRRTMVTSRRGKAGVTLSVALLVAGTAGLFFLIKPGMQDQPSTARAMPILPNSIAVLPFENASENPADAYLTDGLSDELRDQLGRVSGLRIAARSSSIVAREGGADARSVASRLGVAQLLEGNLRRQGNILHVSVELVDGQSGLALWSKRFERGPRELLSIQQAIAEAVVHHVLPKSNEAVAQPATRDPTANELMLLARHYEQSVGEREVVDIDMLQQAVQLYRKATEADPESALAHSRLAGALLYLGDIDAAEAPVFRAVALDPGLAEVQHTLGRFYFARGLPDMQVPLARAVKINPNNPDALATYAYWLWSNEGNEGVDDLYRRALELDPLNVARYGAMGSYLALENRPEDAREIVRRVEALFDSASAYRVIAEILDLLGDVDQSIAWTIRARDLEPDNPWHVEKLAEYYVDIEDYETAVSLVPEIGVGLLFKMRRYDRMIDRAELLMFDFPEDIRLRTYLAAAYNATGNFGAALRILETSGLLNTIANGWRSNEEWYAFITLVDAAYGIGEIERAREIIEWSQSKPYASDSNDWAYTVLEACMRSIQGVDDETRRFLELARTGRHLVWDPMLKDAACFERFANDPVYQATVSYFDDRRRELRDRLPATLAEFDVSL